MKVTTPTKVSIV